MATASQQKTQLSAQERALLFGQMTRNMYQMLPTKIVEAEMSTVQFDIPKNRLLSKIILEVDATATLKSNAASIALANFSPYTILRRVSVDLNNGFSPFVVSGRELFLYNLCRLHTDVMFPQSSKRGMVYVENAASAAGTDARIFFKVELPITLNERDPVGLIALQNPETNVTVTVDVDKLANAYKLNQSNNDQVIFKSMTITAMTETFTVPPVPEAFPDISVLKLVGSKRDTFSQDGLSIIRLSTGTIYRKLFLYFEDTNGNPLTNDDFKGNLELIFNQADIPYSVKPSFLSAINHAQLGYALPDGVYIFDFSNQGVPNLGGSRDYIDTEKLTEFWLRFTASKSGQVTVVSETLTRLTQA
jgi:hypothetical protein